MIRFIGFKKGGFRKAGSTLTLMLDCTPSTQALAVTGFGDLLNSTDAGPYTVFAPPNFAWEKTFDDPQVLADLLTDVCNGLRCKMGFPAPNGIFVGTFL